jgi:oligopeptidase B
MKNTLLFHFVCVIFAASFTTIKAQSMSHTIAAPVAKILPKQLKKHNEVRIDNYYWLNDRENPEVIDYLNQENAYYDAMTAHTKDFQKSLFEEMKGRIKEDDQSVPYLYNGYYYITRYEKGQDYPIYSRKKGSLEAKEEILFDCNVLAKGHTFFQLGGLSVSPDNRFASFGIDIVGRRIYTIQIKNLETNEILSDMIENATGGSVWANDNQTLFYTRQDKVTLRANQIFKHKLGSTADKDILVYEEKDETFNVSVGKEKSKKYIVIGAESTLTTEYRILNSDTTDAEFKVFKPRVRGLEYSISHFGDSFYILTNKPTPTITTYNNPVFSF